MKDKYDPEDLIGAIERLGALRRSLDSLIYDSVLEPIDELISQAFIAKRHIDQLEEPQ